MKDDIKAQDAEIGMRLYPHGVTGDPENETWVTIDQIAPRGVDQIVINHEFIFSKSELIAVEQVEDLEQDSEFVQVPKAAIVAYLGSSDAEKWPELAKVFRHAINPQVTNTYTVIITADPGTHDALLTAMQSAIEGHDAEVKWTDA